MIVSTNFSTFSSNHTFVYRGELQMELPFIDVVSKQSWGFDAGLESILGTIFIGFFLIALFAKNKSVISEKVSNMKSVAKTYAEKKSSKASSTEKPQYTLLNHPKQSVMDKMVNFFFPPIIKSLTTVSHKNSDHVKGSKDSKALQKIRKNVEIPEWYAHVPFCAWWNRKIRKFDKDDYLVGGTVMVDRDTKILSKWNIATDKKDQDTPTTLFDMESPVEIEITCPSSVVLGGVEFDDANSNIGYRKFKACNLEKLRKIIPSSVPIILYFHGGGFVFGSPRDFFPCFVSSLLSQSNNNGVPPVVLASVNYRLCPENPFPAAPIDALSAAQAFMEAFPNSKFHICGFSAGGNLSTMVGFECVRRFPGMVKSIVAIQPFLNPRANSSSYNTNAGACKTVSPEMLRWCWASYLQYDSYNGQDSSEALKYHELFQLGGIGCINPMLRLCYPQVDIPMELRAREGSIAPPQVFVLTGHADPLDDDGLNLIESLEQYNINVKAYKSLGSHFGSVLLDRKCMVNLTKDWAECIW